LCGSPQPRFDATEVCALGTTRRLHGGVKVDHIGIGAAISAIGHRDFSHKPDHAIDF
jgi:hypothetical protein